MPLLNLGSRDTLARRVEQVPEGNMFSADFSALISGNTCT